MGHPALRGTVVGFWSTYYKLIFSGIEWISLTVDVAESRLSGLRIAEGVAVTDKSVETQKSFSILQRLNIPFFHKQTFELLNHMELLFGGADTAHIWRICNCLYVPIVGSVRKIWFSSGFSRISFPVHKMKPKFGLRNFNRAHSNNFEEASYLNHPYAAKVGVFDSCFNNPGTLCICCNFSLCLNGSKRSPCEKSGDTADYDHAPIRPSCRSNGFFPT
jgi:hypothetical protein